MKIVVVSGGFDPLHSGHILLMNSAKTYGDYLIVGVNSDEWLVRKKGRAFMTYIERAALVNNMKAVDEVMPFDDSNGSACNLLETVKSKYPNHQIIFANGGDRTAVNIPEMEIKDVIFQFGVGGNNKANSSSWILQEWKVPKTLRPWGYYRILHDVPGMKVKELTVNPGQALSNQRHEFRSEYWIVSEGRCVVKLQGSAPTELSHHDTIDIPVGYYHKLLNPHDIPCRIVEIQYGDQCIEDDIIRKEE
jgi:D-beta-D-heptose 7-phosphate kinase/D-beta-D-heptose 1-phosphate adenosyltransferase